MEYSAEEVTEVEVTFILLSLNGSTGALGSVQCFSIASVETLIRLHSTSSNRKLKMY